MKTNCASIFLFAAAATLLHGCAFAPSQSSYADLPQARPEPSVSRSDTTITLRTVSSSVAIAAPTARTQTGETPEPALLDLPPLALRMPASTPANHDQSIQEPERPGDAETLKTSPTPAEEPPITGFSTDGFQPFALSPDQQLNRINLGKFNLTGSFVEAYKARNPLHVLNPFAARDLGSVEGNLARDATNGKVSGLKLFSFDF